MVGDVTRSRLWQDAAVTHPSIVPSIVLAVGLLAGYSGPAAAQRTPVQPTLDAYALLGVDSVRLAPGVEVRPGAVGVMAGGVRLGGRAQVSGSVVADAVHVARRVDVGRLFCGLVSGPGFSPAGGSTVPSCLQMTKPIADAALLAPVAVVPGTADVRVRRRSGSAPLAPGAYGAIVVGPGSVLPLSGGTYQVRSIRVAARAQLVCRDDCRIGILENVRLGRRARLGAERGPDADGVRLDIAASAGGVAFRAGPGVTVFATVFSPSGAVVLGQGGEYRGAYIGRSVTVRPRARVNEDSAFAPPPG